MPYRLLADENTGHALIAASQQLVPGFHIIHMATWQEGRWLGLDDQALLLACADANLILVSFDRSTLAWQAIQLLRIGQNHAGIILFRGLIRPSDFGYQARLLTTFWHTHQTADWQNRLTYLPLPS